ncbi:MAG TPA: T9SS type A sorting domain-containing protein [Flavisolibacter sp.]|nr:T9SS type A sorting domain-containing protein [Flavisolibacter sp.]
MKNHRFSRTLLVGAFFFLLAAFQVANSQVQTARYLSMGPNVKGFYEYLPQGYNASGSETYPFILFIHGLGETGDGSPANLPKVLRNGIPKLINNGQFPASFTVNGQMHRFIVISPQFNAWPSITDVDAVVEYVKSNYKVDTRRIYVTGLSMGGGATWDYGGCSSNLSYVQKVAAIVPICGASWPSPERAQTIATYNLPVWALHNQGDGTAPVSYTNDYINLINNRPSPPNPLAKKTIFPVSGHDAWTKAYDPNYRENNMNVYEWMLQYSRGTATPPPPAPNAAPIVNAGADAAITLPSSTASLTASASDADGTIASYRWEIVSQPAGAAALISSSTSAAASVSAMTIAGLYRFKITVTDNKGAAASDQKDIVVNAAPTTGTGSRSVKVNLFSGTNPEPGWNNWNVNSSLSSGSLNYDNGTASGISATLSQQAGVADNTSGYATTMCPAGVGRYASYSMGSRTLTIDGLTDGRSYSLEVYSSRQGATGNSTRLTINGTSQTVSTDNNLANKFYFASLSSASGRMVVTIDKLTSYNYVNGFVLTEAGTAPPPNQAPVVNAGTDKTITLPVSSIAMTASASDADGSIASYAWTKLSGPTSFAFSSASVLNPTISTLVQGSYVFRLTVTDNAGATRSDDVAIVVNPAVVVTPPPPPPAVTKYIKVNIFGGTNPFTSTEWNNWNTNSSLSSAALTYSDGSSSTVRAALSQQTGVGDNGTGYNTTMCPAAVGRYASYSTATRELVLTGLDNSKTYDLELYASRNGATNNTTRYTLGTAISIKTDNNLTNKASYTGIKPIDGKITVTIEKLTTYNYINGFTLTEATATTVAARSSAPGASALTEPEAGLQLFPNPVQDRFSLKLQNGYKGQLTVLITDMSGVVQKRFTLNKTTEGAYQSYLSIQDLKQGEYILSVQMGDTILSSKLSKL